ncbi:MAG: hypothetical protein NTZ36_03525 [Candidatus Jorgensenbacteria bacterium]|nr:hypothetical protein [Candidatus Jorgensenbacteria bacterium]
MENPEHAQREENIETKEAQQNPNRIGELLSVGTDLATSPDKVYRSVGDIGAINDLKESGIVRNAKSAGVKENSRWGDAVFWSRGRDGGYHIVSQGGFVIEAPFSVASERAVTSEDITAIYTKNEKGEVSNTLAVERASEGLIKSEREASDIKHLEEVRRSLGLIE